MRQPALITVSIREPCAEVDEAAERVVVDGDAGIDADRGGALLIGGTVLLKLLAVFA
jgi:hypothetical protein